jgi:hypothetical protein
MSAAIWCKEHVPTKTIVHRMHDVVDDTGLNALQLYIQNFKQADLTLTGTVRKATLFTQSTKAVNSVSATPLANRRTSTTANTNGGSLGGRGSVSYIKVEDTSAEMALLVSTGSETICVTCSVDVSPKWWPFRPVLANTTVDSSMGSSGDHAPPGEPLGTAVETGTGHIALAAAALHQDTQKPVPVSTEAQCHKCHLNKARVEPSPPPIQQREVSRPPIAASSTINGPATDADMIQTRTQYAWPPPPTYSTNSPYSNWSRHSPASQSVTLVNQLNGNHSPRVPAAVVQQVNGQPQLRQSAQPLSDSPHQNGHVTQTPNGYPLSPHRGIASSTPHMQNGAYASYASTRPAPQHLTNGGPPPRAPEHPFSQSNMNPRSSFGPPQGSPPVLRESHPPGRDVSGLQSNNGVRPNDGRVNGGASASPSLRNLLS